MSDCQVIAINCVVYTLTVYTVLWN